MLSRPSDSRSARSRSVPIFRHDRPAWRRLTGSTASSSAGDGRWPPNRVSMRARVRRVAATDSCCPVTWKSRAPYRSMGGSSAIQACGSKSGRSPMSRARTGSASRRWARACSSQAGRLGTSPPELGPGTTAPCRSVALESCGLALPASRSVISSSLRGGQRLASAEGPFKAHGSCPSPTRGNGKIRNRVRRRANLISGLEPDLDRTRTPHWTP